MSFAGHVLDMINRMKQNAALKASKRNKFKGNAHVGIHGHEEHHKTELVFPQATPEELEELKRNIRIDAAQSRKKVNMMYAMAAVFLVAFLLVLYLTF